MGLCCTGESATVKFLIKLACFEVQQDRTFLKLKSATKLLRHCTQIG